MSQHDEKQFLELYRLYRYEDQLAFYKDRQQEFETANIEAISLSVGLIFLAALTAGVASATPLPWLRLTCLLIAAICPTLSTALAGYNALYAFEQQAKLYRDTAYSLMKTHALAPDVEQDLDDAEFAQKRDHYIHEVEAIFLVEQGQWGQLARKMKPSET
jgi:hypothetical protein